MKKHIGRRVRHYDDGTMGTIVDSKVSPQGWAYMLKVYWDDDGSIDWHDRDQIQVLFN